jgi:hypothetical protein
MADALLAPSSSTATEEVTTLIIKESRGPFGFSEYIKAGAQKDPGPANDSSK